MSRRRFERALPDFSQEFSRGGQCLRFAEDQTYRSSLHRALQRTNCVPQLSLSPSHQDGGIFEALPDRLIAGDGVHGQWELQLRPGLGWVRLNHSLHRVAAARAASSGIAGENPHEGGARC